MNVFFASPLGVQMSDAAEAVVPHSMSFSADGKHSAYAILVNFSQCQIVRDGVATNVPSLVPFNTRTRSGVDFPPLFFSGDGTRLAWGWGKTGGVSKDVISIAVRRSSTATAPTSFPSSHPTANTSPP